MISENIHQKPLTKFMSDQIKNVIESGQEYTDEHFQSLLAGMAQLDLQEPEVKIFI